MKIGTIQKWFLVWFAGMVAFCYVTYPSYAPIKSAPYTAHVIADRRIYFMNLRRYYYEEKTDSASNFRLYSLKKWPTNTPDTMVQFVLIDNWLQDEMYIMPQIGEPQKNYKMIVGADTFPLLHSNAEKWHRLAVACYKSLNENQPIVLIDSESRMPLFTTDEGRKAALTVLEDYLKLVRQVN